MNKIMIKVLTIATLAVLASASLVPTARAIPPTNYWDPQGVGVGTNGSDGSGTWDSGANWWNGTADHAWTPGNVAYIGSGTPGTYNITINGTSAYSTTVNNSGYTFSGGNLTNTNSLVVSGNVNVTFNNHVYLSSGVGITIGNGATLTSTGGLTSLGGSDTFNGNTTGILAIPSGTVTLSGAYIMHTIINQTGGALSSGEFFVGYGGPGTWNISGGTASSTSAVNDGSWRINSTTSSTSRSGCWNKAIILTKTAGVAGNCLIPLI